MTEDKLEIRDCKDDDLNEIQEIEETSFLDPYSPAIFWSLYLDPENTFRVAILGGKLVGYLVNKFEEDENQNRIAHIVSLSVSPNYRRRGIGSMLLADTLAIVRNASPNSRMIELEVRMDNREAIELYRRFGFKVEYTLLNYYGLRRHALKMKLELAGWNKPS